MSVVSITDEARSRLSVLVDQEWFRVRSRMLAYHNVGRLIGASGHWVRKFVKGYAEATPSLPVGMNIMAQYDELCAKIEADTNRRLGRINAADKGNHEVVLGILRRASKKDET